MNKLDKNEYSSFLVEIKVRIRQGQYQALRAANKELLDFIGILVSPFIKSRKVLVGENAVPYKKRTENADGV